MLTIDHIDDWPERLRAQTAERRRRPAARAAVRLQRARRRLHGMIDRNAGRLAGARARARRSAASPGRDPTGSGRSADPG
jgi:hypothetical protein